MKVKIKSWTEMKNLYGLTHKGNIECALVFTHGMETLLPQDRIIDITKIKESRYRWDAESINDSRKYIFSISNDMIEEFID